MSLLELTAQVDNWLLKSYEHEGCVTSLWYNVMFKKSISFLNHSASIPNHIHHHSFFHSQYSCVTENKPSVLVP